MPRYEFTIERSSNGLQRGTTVVRADTPMEAAELAMNRAQRAVMEFINVPSLEALQPRIVGFRVMKGD